jgi:hypothetical protein
LGKAVPASARGSLAGNLDAHKATREDGDHGCRLLAGRDWVDTDREPLVGIKAAVRALTLLPDILHYDRTRPAHYPNGRVMTDDVFSTRMIFMVHGQATPPRRQATR